MRPLSAPELLRAWERGHPRALTDRALLLLAEACPERRWEDLAALPIGVRDSLLLTLREWAFGPGLSSLVDCPGCGTPLELSFSVADLRADPPTGEQALTLQADGYHVEFRLPDSTDMATLPDADNARGHLLSRCVRSASRDGEPQAVDSLPDRVLDAVARRMGEADPQAHVETTLSCPECRHEWAAVFDVVSFLWEEVERWAHGTLRDVHTLASAYGWDEARILGLSPTRRQLYLHLVHDE